MTATILHSGTALDADGAVPDSWIRFEDGVVAGRGTGADWRAALHEGDRVVDVAGRRILPGFLDLHVHGGGGHSFDADVAEEILAGLAVHRAHGTTASLVSFVAAPIDVLEERLRLVAALAADHPGILGAHLEGPFLAATRRGAHTPEALRAVDSGAVDRLLDAGGGALRQVTIAPELPGALEAIERFTAAGVVVAVGHTEADYATARAAFDRGARLLTHAFNAMPGIGHRAPGPVTAAIDDERVIIELILDGRHVHPSVARMLFALAPGRVALITDAMAAAGSADGDYRLGAQNVSVRGGIAVLRGTATLAGSTLTQDAALRRAVEDLGLDAPAAVGALTSVPAAVLGLAGERGHLAPGMAGDAVLLDGDWCVLAEPAG